MKPYRHLSSCRTILNCKTGVAHHTVHLHIPYITLQETYCTHSQAPHGCCNYFSNLCYINAVEPKLLQCAHNSTSAALLTCDGSLEVCKECRAFCSTSFLACKGERANTFAGSTAPPEVFACCCSSEPATRYVCLPKLLLVCEQYL